MYPVDMKTFHDGIGDCFRACVASIFEFPIDEMPNFWEQSQDAHDFWTMVNNWTTQYLGCKAISVEFSQIQHNYFINDLLCVAIGKHPRSEEEHAVVWKNGMIHDPHPSRAGIGEPQVFTFFVPLEISNYFMQCQKLASPKNG